MSTENSGFGRGQSRVEKSLPPLPSYEVAISKLPAAVNVVEFENHLSGDLAGAKWEPREENLVKKQYSWKSLLVKGATFRRSDDRIRHWKPQTLQAPILGSFIVISLGLLAILEVLHQYSSGSRAGGLVFAETVNDLPAYAIVGYQYLPTVIAVCYSMLWGWVDLDVKRLEPYFQLSKPGGANARDSLLLQYPFEFLAFVPVTAARRKHWSVFCAGLTMMIIFWVITPLQSAIFSTGQVTRNLTVEMMPTAEIMPLLDQSRSMGMGFLNNAYAVSWLSQKLPPFTTSTYGIPPFAPVVSPVTFGKETWSADTVAYSTSLHCSPANVTADTVRSTYTFSDNTGCVVPSIELPDAKSINATYLVQYLGYHGDSSGIMSQLHLQNPNCSSEHSNKFLGIWANAASQGADPSFLPFTPMYANLTAIFCEPSYNIRNVHVTVNASDGAVVDSNFSAALSLPLSPTTVNTASFEFMIGTGGVSDVLAPQNYPNRTAIQQYPRLLNYSLASPITNMVGFLFGTGIESAEVLHDPEIFQQSLQKAHQLLFSLAINGLMISHITDQPSQNGILQDRPAAIIFVHTFSIIVQSALGLTAGLAALLWYMSNRRRSMMASDPASISSIMSLMVDSDAILEEFKDNGTVTAEILERRTTNQMYRLAAVKLGDTMVERLEAVSYSFESSNSVAYVTTMSPTQEHKSHNNYKTVQPKEMTLYVGAVLLAVIAAAIILISVLFRDSSKNNGIQRPSNNTLVLSLIENLVPTAFASMLEPFWVVLNRLLCLLQPYEELQKGNAIPSRSIKARYTSLPPQLTLWRALVSRHFLLAAVCGISISFNILAVALSGLFNEAEVAKLSPYGSSYKMLPEFNGAAMANFSNAAVAGYYYDEYYVATSNAMAGTALPKWVDEDRYYIPFDLPDDKGAAVAQSVQEIQGTTRGFGISADCQPLKLGSSEDNSIEFSVANNFTEVQILVTKAYQNGTLAQCVTASERPSGKASSLKIDPPGTAASALEDVSYLLAADEPYDPIFCGQFLLVGWARLSASTPPQQRSVDSSFMICTPALETSLYNVSMDTSSNIKSSVRTTPKESDIRPYFPQNSSSALIKELNFLVGGSAINNAWHNDSVTRDFMNSLLQIKLNTTLVDPSTPLPNVTELSSAVAKEYRKLFAILLGLNPHVFSSVVAKDALTIQILSTETRIFMSLPMMIISTIILAHTFLVAIWYYAARPKSFLPRMPTSIGSVLAYVSAGHTFSAGAPHNVVRKETVGAEEQRYAYGWFIGRDMNGHVGIDLAEHVVPFYGSQMRKRKQ